MPRLITFGGLSVQNGAVLNGAANPRIRLAILAVIAAAGDRGVRREKLTALFWPDSDDERARNALRQALFTLKRDIGAGDITLGSAELRLNPEVLTSDVGDFEAAIRASRWEDAAILYQGTFLDGVVVREAPEFERWRDEQQRRYAADFGRALEKAAAAAAARGDLTGAIERWERRSAHDPLSGRVTLAFMEALAANGERERAIHQASIYSKLVRQELEADPDRAVVAFASRLRDAPEAPRPSAGHTAVPQSNPAVEGEAPVATPLPGPPETVGAQPLPARRARPIAWSVVGLAVLSTAILTSRLSSTAVPVQPGLVAIGALEAPNGDARLRAVGDQVSSSVAQLLAQSKQVSVIELRRTTGSSGRTRDASPEVALDEHAKRSRAQYLVRGHVNWRSDSVVVVAQIVDATNGRLVHQADPAVAHLASATTAVAKAGDAIAGAVLALTDTVFSTWSDGQSRPPGYAAHNEFMQGLDALVNQGAKEAIPHLLRSMTIDPGFVHAKLWYLEQADLVPAEAVRIDSVRAALAATYKGMSPYDQAAVDRELAFLDGRLEDAYTAARRMVAIAPRSSEAMILLAQASMATRRFHEALQVLHRLGDAPVWLRPLGQRRGWDLEAHRLLRDFEGGIAEWRQSVAEAPDDWRTCGSGIPLLAASGSEAAVDSLITACLRIPDAPPFMGDPWVMAARNFRFGGHAQAADRAFEKVLAAQKGLDERDPRRRPLLGQTYLDLEDWPRADSILRSIGALNPRQRVNLAIAAAHLRDSATVRETLQWLQGRERRRHGADMDRAVIQVALGQHTEALASLRLAMEVGVAPAWSGWYVRSDLNPLRGDPRFQELIRPRR